MGYTGVMDEELRQALREWGSICQALGEGAIVALVRKGGIHERGGGLFQLRYQRFFCCRPMNTRQRSIIRLLFLHPWQTRLRSSIGRRLIASGRWR